MRSKITRKTVLGIGAVVLSAALMLGVTVFGVSAAVKNAMSENLRSMEKLSDEDAEYDCVIVLGAGVYDDGRLSPMLRDRVIVGCDIFLCTHAKILIMSGDKHGSSYDEPEAMRKYAMELGIDPDVILKDNEGYSTFESIYRAKHEYGAEKIIIVSQEYHLYRALYIAKSLDMEAVGVSADLDFYSRQKYRDLREALARFKDFLLCEGKS